MKISNFENKTFVLDGAMGTLLQKKNLSEKDFRGKRFFNHSTFLKNNYDILCLTKPDLIQQVHNDYIIAGADIIETNTFNANKFSLAVFGLSDVVYELNFEAARIARLTTEQYDKKIYVAGSIGPSNKMLSALNNNEQNNQNKITFEDVVAAYTPQIKGLIDAGVDFFLVETIIDAAMAKAIIDVIKNETELRNIKIPIIISCTTNKQGRILSGQTVYDFFSSIDDEHIFAWGLNCGTEINNSIKTLKVLSEKTDKPLIYFPSIGLPDVNGKYKSDLKWFENQMIKVFDLPNIKIIGSCCGSTPEHTKVLKNLLKD